MILPFDKDILDTTVKDVESRLGVINVERQELILILQSMMSIQDEVFFTEEADGRLKKDTRAKKDPDTREEFTATRRNTIYDMNVPKAQIKITESI